MKILLSVGHSILKNGNCTSADGRPYGGLLEYSYNKGIVNQVAAYLRKAGHEVDVLICPEMQFSKSSEEKTYKLAKENAGTYDLVAELHLNASKLHSSRGCETLYVSEKGKVYAQCISDQLGTVFKNRGIQKRTDLYMLNSTKAPAVIIESFFCDSSADCELAANTDVALLIAQGIAGTGIEAEKETVQTGILYRVQTGAFSNKLYAERLVNNLKKKGFDAFIVPVDLGAFIYRVQVGAYSVKTNAEKMKVKLLEVGFDAFIVNA